jgi:hypothetical protein
LFEASPLKNDNDHETANFTNRIIDNTLNSSTSKAKQLKISPNFKPRSTQNFQKTVQQTSIQIISSRSVFKSVNYKKMFTTNFSAKNFPLKLDMNRRELACSAVLETFYAS